MKLYELSNDYLALMNAIENDELPEEAVADTLESIVVGIEDKADNIACVLKNLSADIAAIKAEEERLAERRKSKERLHERIKQYLSDTLLLTGIDKVETARNKITFLKSEAVETDKDFLEWALKYRDDLITYGKPSANKTKIKEAIKNGQEIVGAQIVSKQNIQIK